MASYKSGFDPPPRPSETSRARRLGTYMQQGAARMEKLEHREADIAHLSGQMEGESRLRAPSTGRPQQTGLPRPSMRDPSPSTRPKLEERRTGSSSASFGFSRNAPKTTAPPAVRPTPELRGKSSRNVLRRKPSSVAQQAEPFRPQAERKESSSSSTKFSSTSSERRPSVDATQRSAEAYNEIFTRPARSKTPAAKESPQIYPELDRYRFKPETMVHNRHITDLPHKLSTQDLPPSTSISGTPVYSGGSSHHRYSGYSGSGYSASPSTRFSESPGPGAYSRDTTPTSISSQSPGILAPMKPTTTPRLRQGSPALNRPPLSTTGRRRAASISSETEDSQQGLPSLRESITSSSSNSTVKGDGKAKEGKEKKKKKRLSPLPPSPPPRKSSQKFKKSRSEEPEDSPSKPSQAPAKPVMMSPADSSPAKPVRPTRTTTPVITKATPPMRPSREGAPDLHVQMGVSPIVQSNLTGLPQSRRYSALPKPRSVGSSPQMPSQPTLRPQPGSRLPSRNNLSPSPIIPSPREATPAPSGLGIIPDLRPHPPTSRGISRTPSPSVSNTKSRFGLFSRRTKTTPEVTTLENRGSRKGPAAGTGHEGYGKYAASRGRSSSAGGFSSRQNSISLSIATSSSQESVSSTRTHDPFLLHRMSPVIIAGGGEIIENRNASSELTRTESNTSLPPLDRSRQSLESKGSGLSREVERTTLWPSAMPKEQTKRASAMALPKGRRTSDSSDDGVGKSSLAFRRSVLNNSTGPLNLPRPLNFENMVVSPSMTSLDASILSDESLMERAEIGTARKGMLTKPKKLEKKPKEPRKWNFFHRSQPNKPQPEPMPAMQVTVGKAPAKAIPHYALLDSSDDQLDPDSVNLEDLLRDAEVVAMSNEELDALQFGHYKEEIRRKEQLDNLVTPDLPEIISMPEPRIETPPAQIFFSSPEPMQTPEPMRMPERPKSPPPTDLHLTQEPARVRPSRLPQVGRIPKVISARPETTSPKSFSRPFARLSTVQPILTPLVIDTQSVAVGPSPPKPSTPEPQTEPQPEISAIPKLRQESTDSKSDSTTSHRDFLAFSPRKNSEATTSSSGGVSGLSFAATTAVIPAPDDPLEEDEMWDEYDDLIENPDDDTMRVPVSATSSHGVPFQYESYESRRLRKSKIRAKESPTLTSTPVIKEPEQPEPSPERRSALTSSSVYSVDMSARLKDALQAAPSPTTPLSFTEFFSGYGDRNNSVHEGSAQKKRHSSSSRSRKSGSSSTHSRSRSELMPIAEADKDTSSPISQVNLRVGSMTVSKWLTFGHVLFSPAREEIAAVGEQSKRHSILVIDGLGNDDWSFYAAETYPNSTFYNLSPTRPWSTDNAAPAPSFPLTPPNHRQVEYVSPLNKFPFPSSTFTVVVFRFPSAMSDPAYRNIISETKRVLKPGGYLEMAILDLDMMNMGNRTRRAVRGVKVKISNVDSGISLSNASDTVLKMVGRRGFEGIKSCMVGVPVASNIPLDPAAPSSSTSPPKDPKTQVLKQELSLTDLLHTPTSPAVDSSITKQVAKVGRWWYSRCYENLILAGGDQSASLFNDEVLLGECEEWRSSFKLCVAVARKPSLMSRPRGASV